MIRSYKGFFKDWEIAIVRKLINEFKNKWELFKREEDEDLLQECLAQWYFVKDKYDSSKQASEKTFMARIIRNKLKNIIEKIYAAKRKPLYESISLEKPLGNDEEAPTLIDTIAENDSTSTNPFLWTQLRMDISKAYQKLTSKQKTLCHLIGKEGLTPKEASKYLNVSLDAIYEEIRRIRAVFKKEDLEDYLK